MKKLLQYVLLFLCAASFTSFSQEIITPDGQTDVYTYLRSKGMKLEVPDCYHNYSFQHVSQGWDSVLNKYVFAFTLHVSPFLDKDRCRGTDRQRCELTLTDTLPGTPYLNAGPGDTFIYSWKFKLDAGFQANTSFFHIHQIKAVDGPDAGSALMTLTARKGTPDHLQLIYSAPSGVSGGGTLTQVDLTPFKGIWVQVVEKMTFIPNSPYSIVITKVSSGDTLFNYTSSALNFVRSGATQYRPKIGLYRSLGNITDIRDETTRFADFTIRNLSNSYSPNTVNGHEIAPAAPINITIAKISSASITVQWYDNSYNEDHFRVERSPDGTSNWSTVLLYIPTWERWADSVPPQSLTYTYVDLGLEGSTKYYYRIRAENLYGNSSYTNIVNATTTASGSPLPPANLTAAVFSASQVNLAWIDNSDNESDFRIERSVNDTSAWTLLKTVGANITQYSDTGLSQITYYYRVRAENSNGNSNYSNVANATPGVFTGDNIWIEAESGTITNPIVIQSDPLASGGSYIVNTVKDNTTPTASNVDYNFNVKAGGPYIMWGRTLWPSNSYNSMFVEIDGADWFSWSDDNAISTTWRWTKVKNGSAVATFNLAVGIHALHLARREQNAQLDAILITNDTSFVPATTLPTEVQATNEKTLAPKDFSLQNYPNPFNPSTVIQYSLPLASQVHLTIYNIAGKEVDPLIHEYQNAGVYRFTWNTSTVQGGQLASGMYFARMTAGTYSKTIKLLLMK